MNKKNQKRKEGRKMKNKIATNQKKARINVLIEKIREGYSRKELVQWTMDNFGFKYKFAWDYVNEAYQTLADYNDEDLIGNTRAIQLERAEAILKDALEHGDRKSALKALDIINRMNSLYVEKREISLKDSDLVFRLE